MTDEGRRHRNSPAWQRFRAARTVAHHAADAAEVAELLDILGLTAAEGLAPPEETPEPERVAPPTPLADDSVERLSTLLRDTLPSARQHQG
jgi:hypothetical protein